MVPVTTASLEALIQAFGVAGATVVLVVSALLTAGYLLPAVVTEILPGRDFITERREAVQMTWPVTCLCRGCGADGSAARRPAALAGSSGGPAVP